MGATVSHALSMTSPNITLFENRPEHWNSSHLFTLNAAGSEISGAFGNGGGVSFGLSADGKVTAGAPQSNAFNLLGANTAGNTTATGSTIGLSGVNLTLSGVNGSQIVFSAPAQSVATVTGFLSISTNGSTISFGAGPLSFYATGNTTQSTSGTIDGRSITFQGTGGASVGISNGSIVISGATGGAGGGGIGGGVSTFGNTAGSTGTVTTGNIVFVGSGAISLSQSTGAAGSAATISILGPATSSLSATGQVSISTNGSTISIGAPAFSGGFSTGGNTAGDTGLVTGRLVLYGNNNITLSGSTNGGSMTVSISGGAGAAGNTGFISAGAATASLGTVVFSNSNGVSFGVNGQTVTGSVAAQSNQSAIKGFGVSNTGATAGNTGISTGIDWVMAGSNLLTLSQSTAGGGPNTVWIQHPAWLTTARASTDAIGLNTAQSNVTWTVNSSGLSLDARGYAGTGTTFTGANISGSLTQNSVGINVSLSVPATSSLVGTSGLSVSTAGSTISVLPIPLSVWDPFPILSGTAVSSHAPASFWFSRMVLDWDVAVSYANVLKSLNVVAPGASSQNSSLTNKFSYSHGLTLFTRQDFAANSSRMSQWTTASFGMTGTLSQSSSSASVALSWVTNSTGGTTSFSTTSGSNLWTNFFTGMQMFRIPLVTTLTPGEYFVGQAHSSTTATVGSNFTLLSVSNLHVAPQSNTFATITSSGSLAFSSPDGLGIGVASAITTNNTMAMSVISANTQNWWYMNFSNV